MKKKKINQHELLKLLTNHDLERYDICKICSVSATTAERWVKDGIPESYYKLIKLSLGDL